MDLEKLKKDELIAKIQELQQTEAGQLQAQRDEALEKLAAAEAATSELQGKLEAAEADKAEALAKLAEAQANGDVAEENEELKLALADATERLRISEGVANAPVIVKHEGKHYRIKGATTVGGQKLMPTDIKERPELVAHLVSIGSGLLEERKA